MDTKIFEKYLNSHAHAHLIGIGGVSMSPLAEVLLSAGMVVTGSDIVTSPVIERLRELGIDVSIGHAAENIDGADLVIRTAAAREDNVEILAARENGIPVFERAEAWGYIMRGYRDAVCIAGTHGKTTTTSMITHIFMAADADPTVMIGGTLPLLNAGYRVGGGETIIMESCEYYNSFHSFFPTVAVILNIEADHLDYFKNLDEIKESFRVFASLVPDGKYIVCNADDENTINALTPLNRELITFGLGDGAVVRGVNITPEGNGNAFDIIYNGGVYAHVRLQVPGMHNIYNALAAAAAAITLDIPGEAVSEGLGGFTGARRRFEYKGSYNDAAVYDDYAHHPGELKALLDAVSKLNYKRIVLAFQPHTFTRTKALFGDFIQQLRRADVVLLAEIYAAREKNTIGISSRDLAEAVPGAVYCESLTEIERLLRGILEPGDIILTVGAGDIYKAGEALLARS